MPYYDADSVHTTENRQRTNGGKWSDGDQWVQETAEASDVSEEVMTRSRM